VLKLREIAEDELARLVRVLAAVRPRERWSAENLVDWRRQAEETIWLLACDGYSEVGAGIGVHGWHSEPGVVRTLAFVPEELRGRGIGSALLARLAGWAAAHGGHTVEGTVEEDDASSIAWLQARGYVEVGRNSTMRLDLPAVAEPPVDPPSGIEIVSWAERPEAAAGMYEVACEAYPDIPGEEDTPMGSFEAWLATDMEGLSDRAEATFVALAGDQVVGYAKLSLSASDTEYAFHDITGVRRAWRGRGIASALKRAEIAWAKRNGFTHLETWNEVRNTPIRILNERYGYTLQPGRITMRRAISAGS
jgi:GNAT superfamily N-acetyltransferase